MDDASWNPKPCPFCGHTDIVVRDSEIDYMAGQGCPSSAIRTVNCFCLYCHAEGPKRTIDALYDEEIEAAALVAWNKRTK